MSLRIDGMTFRVLGFDFVVEGILIWIISIMIVVGIAQDSMSQPAAEEPLESQDESPIQPSQLA